MEKLKQSLSEIFVSTLRLLLTIFFLHEEVLDTLIVEVPFFAEHFYVVYNKLKKPRNNSLDSKRIQKQVRRPAFFILLTTIIILLFQQDRLDELLLRLLLRSLPTFSRFVIDSTYVTTQKKRLREWLNNRNRQ